MQICVYEFVTGGGFLDSQELPPASLQREGAAMLSALAADFAKLPDTSVLVPADYRMPEMPNSIAGCQTLAARTAAERIGMLADLADRCDWTVVIAPEFDSLLATSCRQIIAAGGRLLGPSIEAIRLAADKNRMAEHLAAADVPRPHGRPVPRGQHLPLDFPYPAVLKPFDGAGSVDLLHVRSSRAAAALGPVRFDARLETFVDGLAASVAVLCGETERRPLPACGQHLSDDGLFRYLGGSLPLPSALAQRGQKLALDAVATLDGALGYVGVDLVLGRSPSEDFVIEINPRLTTSYVGLRAACRQNLAEAMLSLAEGRAVELSFGNEHLEFDASGAITAGA